MATAGGNQQVGERGIFADQGIYQNLPQDVYDHTIHIIDTLETFREMATEMLEIYLSSISNRLNTVIKVLTLIATIFMPLT